MNFVIFPMFFASSACIPSGWCSSRARSSTPLAAQSLHLCVERFALRCTRDDWTSLAVVASMTSCSPPARSLAYDPSRGLIARRGGGADEAAATRVVGTGAGRRAARRRAVAVLRRRGRAIPTGLASRSRCRSFLSRRSGAGRRWIRNRSIGSTIRRSPTSCMRSRRAANRSRQAQDKIQTFAQQAKDQKQQKLLALLAGLFDMLNGERGVVIAGWTGLARAKGTCGQIRDDNEKLRQCRQIPPRTPARSTRCAARQWEAEVFQDRRQALGYACDVPGKIEQRLFALARTIQQEVQ